LPTWAGIGWRDTEAKASRPGGRAAGCRPGRPGRADAVDRELRSWRRCARRSDSFDGLQGPRARAEAWPRRAEAPASPLSGEHPNAVAGRAAEAGFQAAIVLLIGFGGISANSRAVSPRAGLTTVLDHPPASTGRPSDARRPARLFTDRGHIGVRAWR
jgi:hypothetical protein